MTSINTKVTTPGTVTTTSVPTTTVTVTSTELASTTNTSGTITYTPNAVTGSSVTATAYVPTAYSSSQTIESPRVTELKASIASIDAKIKVLEESNKKISADIRAGHKEIDKLATEMNNPKTSDTRKAQLSAQIERNYQALASLYDAVAAQRKEIEALAGKKKALQAELDNLLNNNNNINTSTQDVAVTSTADNIPTETTGWVPLEVTTTTPA